MGGLMRFKPQYDKSLCMPQQIKYILCKDQQSFIYNIYVYMNIVHYKNKKGKQWLSKENCGKIWDIYE